MKKIPLNRALSKLGVLSRAQATEAILAGRVRVGGRLVRTPSTLVSPEHARIELDETRARKAAWRTILFHKPRRVVTTRTDPEGRPTIYDVLGVAGTGLIAVGRLDAATSGLLLLTTDTQLANWLTDPQNQVPRVYVVTVRGRVAADAITRLTGEITLRKTSGRESHLLVELREGKNRQVRKMTASVGYPTLRLVRTAIGPVTLGDLKQGVWRELTVQEVANLKSRPR